MLQQVTGDSGSGNRRRQSGELSRIFYTKSIRSCGKQIATTLGSDFTLYVSTLRYAHNNLVGNMRVNFSESF